MPRSTPTSPPMLRPAAAAMPRRATHAPWAARPARRATCPLCTPSPIWPSPTTASPYMRPPIRCRLSRRGGDRQAPLECLRLFGAARLAQKSRQVAHVAQGLRVIRSVSLLVDGQRAAIALLRALEVPAGAQRISQVAGGRRGAGMIEPQRRLEAG